MQGPQGEQGLTGPFGPPGPQGFPGLKGMTGETGVVGEQVKNGYRPLDMQIYYNINVMHCISQADLYVYFTVLYGEDCCSVW